MHTTANNAKKRYGMLIDDMVEVLRFTKRQNGETALLWHWQLGAVISSKAHPGRLRSDSERLVTKLLAKWVDGVGMVWCAGSSGEEEQLTYKLINKLCKNCSYKVRSDYCE